MNIQQQPKLRQRGRYSTSSYHTNLSGSFIRCVVKHNRTVLVLMVTMFIMLITSLFLYVLTIDETSSSSSLSLPIKKDEVVGDSTFSHEGSGFSLLDSDHRLRDVPAIQKEEVVGESISVHDKSRLRLLNNDHHLRAVPAHNVKGCSRATNDPFERYKNGTFTAASVGVADQIENDNIARERRDIVRAAMKHAWSNYEKYSYGYDELQPMSGKGSNNWAGLAATMIDSLDTLWLMDMKDEFKRAREWIEINLDFAKVQKDVSVFETNIRVVGGLLAAYDASGESIFLEKAKDLATRLLNAFQSPSKLPYGFVNLNKKQASNPSWIPQKGSILADLGSIIVEFRQLSKRSGDTKFKEAVDNVHEILYNLMPADGLYPVFVQVSSKNPYFIQNMKSFGAFGDSFYEYMLKTWLLSRKEDQMYRIMYDRAIDGLHQNLLKTNNHGIMFVTSNTRTTEMEHLTCFLPGLLALGAYTHVDGLKSEQSKRDLATAKALAYTCYQMYVQMPSGLAADISVVSNRFSQSDCDFKPRIGHEYYTLRPELMESLFILHHLTRDETYRYWGWEVFNSIEKHCKAQYGYGRYANVKDDSLEPEDKMESFFLAETLKYAYLLQDPDHTIDLIDKHVFNTEAHLFKVI